MHPMPLENGRENLRLLTLLFAVWFHWFFYHGAVRDAWALTLFGYPDTQGRMKRERNEE